MGAGRGHKGWVGERNNPERFPKCSCEGSLYLDQRPFFFLCRIICFISGMQIAEIQVPELELISELV